MCIREYVQNENNRQQFENFVSQKFGYGRWQAPFWFVGPEERGGEDCLDMTTRVAQWAGTEPLNQLDLKDLRNYCERIGVHQYHGIHGHIAVQRTWRALLGLIAPADLAADQFPAWANHYQAHRLGGGVDIDHRRDGVALLEISPLPCPNVRTWLWRCLVEAPVQGAGLFQSKHAFLNNVFVRGRLAHIRTMAEIHHPSFICFYGLPPQFQELATVADDIFGDLQFNEVNAVWQAILPTQQGTDIQIVFMRHPVARLHAQTPWPEYANNVRNLLYGNPG